MSLKITGKVISLLASEIYEKNFEALHKKEDQKFKEAINKITLTKSEEKVAKLLVKTSQEYNEIRKSYGYRYGNGFTSAVKDLLETKKNSIKQPTSKYPTKNQLEKDITLAMLDAKSVEELINKIKHKYKI